MTKTKTHTYAVQKSSNLDSWFRRMLQNPYKLLRPYINEGMTVLDLGCGTGYFSIPLADLVGANGHVIAIDTQQGMLAILEEKCRKNRVENLTIKRNNAASISIQEKLDFAIAIYVMHELPNQKSFLQEVHRSLKKGGKLLIIEPNIIVSRKHFNMTIDCALEIGFAIDKKPKVTFSKAILLVK